MMSKYVAYWDKSYEGGETITVLDFDRFVCLGYPISDLKKIEHINVGECLQLDPSRINRGRHFIMRVG